ncbi:metallophosphoesterase [Desulfosediminicola flagellatus]|uniref:metallophosphoesterase n=1 Tax=Desulfosediminicola flagellatus TaxID=2569541 RepID=UPI0010ABD4F9|nr:metallophosphoesterase [Desulfosediminicola flagellatus]
MQITNEYNRPMRTLGLDRRSIWATVRCSMEADNYKQKLNGGRRRHHWRSFETLLKVFALGLKVTSLYDRGIANARALELRCHDVPLKNLPTAFEGFTILQITDPHFDSMPSVDDRIIELLREQEVDVLAFTGDYRNAIHGKFRQVLPAMENVVRATKAREGVLAVLGNHDTVFMVNPLEEMGVRVLANETVSFVRNGETLHITGVDDVHYYYTEMARDAMETAPSGFRIALVHSPELYDVAAEYGYDLYLAGHTHGGQISLPGGRPIVKHLNVGKHLGRGGFWQHGSVTGYTSNGAGTSGIPLRFNTKPEITLFTLKCDGQ